VQYLQTIQTTPLGQQRISTRPAQDGLGGNLQALSVMAKMVRDDCLREDLRNWVLQNVVRKVRGHNFNAEVQAAFDWARDGIRYTRDPDTSERVADLATTIRTGAGDCKSKSVALATILAILGQRPFFVVLAQTPMPSPLLNWDPRWQFDHVYVGLNRDGNYMPLDPTPEAARPGRNYGEGQRMAFRIFGE